MNKEIKINLGQWVHLAEFIPPPRDVNVYDQLATWYCFYPHHSSQQSPIYQQIAHSKDTSDENIIDVAYPGYTWVCQLSPNWGHFVFRYSG